MQKKTSRAGSTEPVQISRSILPHLDKFHQALAEVMVERGLVAFID